MVRMIGVGRYPHLIMTLWLQGHFCGFDFDARSSPIANSFTTDKVTWDTVA
jgi:hypothetical protein